MKSTVPECIVRALQGEDLRASAPQIVKQEENVSPGASAATSVNTQRALAQLKADGKYESLAAAVNAARYSMERLDPTRDTSRGAEYFAENPQQQLRAWFGREGVEFASGRNEDWSLSLRLATPGVEVEARQQRAEVRRAGIVEWYENKPEGIEQGFTVTAPPAGARGDLRVAMEVGGDLRAVAESEGAVVFHTPAGKPVLRYAELRAWDAADRTLSARIEIAGSQLALVVDDRDAVYPVTIDPLITTPPQAKLVADGSEPESSFAFAVGLDGDTAVFGAYSASTPAGGGAGAAYVFTRTGTVWNQQAKLIASDGMAGDSFGDAIAVSGDTVIVGVPGSDVPTGYTQAGAAYVFVRSGTTWSEQQKLNVTVTNWADTLGRSVAIEGDTAIVGATGTNTAAGLNTGAAYVFTRTGPVWTQQAMLVASDGASSDAFGQSVSVSGDIAVVGSSYASVGAPFTGAAYVFSRSGGSWMEEAKLTASDAAAHDIFGFSVSVSGTTALVGAYHNDTSLGTESGSAYVFVRDGTTWVEQANLTPGTGGSSFHFGYSVALSGDTALVGSRDASAGGLTGAGAAHIFVRSGATWSEQQALDPGDGQLYGIFGCAVALSGDRALVGAPLTNSSAGTRCGSGYIFTRSGTAWTVQTKVMIPGGTSGDYFGYAVGLSGDTAIVGVYQADTAGAVDAGCAYVFTRGGTVWTPLAKLTANDAAADDYFGYSVAVRGNTALVGSIYDRTAAGTVTGSAYVFVRDGTTWPQQAKLAATDGAVGDRFGCAIAIDGDRALVGASRVDGANGLETGAAYVFLRTGTSWAEEQKLAPAALNAHDWFGFAVALSGDYALIGAPLSDVGGVDWGLVYAFHRNAPEDGGWTVHGVLSAGAANYDLFGYAVALSGDTALIGAPDVSTAAGSHVGQAFIFARNGTTWDPPVTLSPSDGVTDDFFGTSVGIDGGLAAVGSYGVDTVAGESVGGVYAFRRTGAAWPQVSKLLASDGVLLDRLGYSVAVSGDTVLAGTYALEAVPGNNREAAYAFVVPAPPIPPVLAPFTITSTNANPLYARTGDSISLVFTSDKPLQTPVVTIAGHSVAPVNTSGNTWSASLVAVAGDPQGLAAFSITATALDGTVAGPITAPTDGSSVKIDTVAPTLGGSFAPRMFFVGTPLPDYASQAVVSDVNSVTVVQSPLAGSATGTGSVFVSVTATDVAGNYTEKEFSVAARPLNPASALVLSKGDPVHGAGGVNGPPADALLASFGLPAIDGSGRVAFTAKWTSTTHGKGSGIFTNTKCVATVGGPVPDRSATFRTLGDPVFDSGYTGFLATLRGVPAANAAAVLSDAPGGTLAVIAQAGIAAPGANGALFKSFKAVSVQGRSVTVFAQLKAPASSDLGVWVQDSTHPLTLMLREGQTIGTKTIKTLVTFAAGSGSPGQGRGWAMIPANKPHVLALALFTDKTQAVLDVDLTGTVTVRSQSGAGGAGGPDIAGASFASYGLPTVNTGGFNGGDTAFLGTLTVGTGGVTKANARGIFANDGGTVFTPIMRVGDVVSSGGAVISVLKDPVFAGDNTIAFPATLKGGGFKGLTKTTLFWKTRSSSLDLLAQGGAGNRAVPDLADAQFKTFPSLAIATGRGPIFTATLVPGKGGVKATNATGVWAMDFTHDMRLLFRTGDTIGGKTVKSFALLKATVGNMGVTRSFNNSQVVWLATFTDKSTAIITTEVP